MPMDAPEEGPLFWQQVKGLDPDQKPKSFQFLWP